MSKKIDDLVDKLSDKISEETTDRVEFLEKEVMRLKKTLEEYGIEQEAYLDDVEYICLKEIERLRKEISLGITLSEKDVKNFDIIHKNLRMARGQIDKKEAPGKKITEDELLKIVKGGKSD